MSGQASSHLPPDVSQSTLTTASGDRWRLHSWGDPDRPGPIVVALHGFSGSGFDWELPVHTLGSSVAAWLAPDLPGHGESIGYAPGAYALDAIRHVLHRWIQSLPRPPVLMGYSMGGRAAVEYAVHHPDTISRLILIGATAGIADDEGRHARAVSDARLADELVASGMQAFANRWEATPLLRSQITIPEPWGSRIRARRRQQSPNELARSLREAGQGTMVPRWDDLHRLKTPTQCVFGANDTRFRTIAEKLTGLLPFGEGVSIPESGHAAHLENCAYFARMIHPGLHPEDCGGASDCQ